MTSIFRRIDDFMFDSMFQPIVDRFPDQGPVGVARFFIMGVICADVLKFLVSPERDAFFGYIAPAYLYASACDVRPPKTRKAPFWQSLFRLAPQGA